LTDAVEKVADEPEHGIAAKRPLDEGKSPWPCARDFAVGGSKQILWISRTQKLHRLIEREFT